MEMVRFLLCLLLTFLPLVSTQGPCLKNVVEVKQEGRRCLPFCSPRKPCPNKISTSCQCDGSCGYVCIPNDLTCPELNHPTHGSVHFPEGRGFQSLAIYDCDEDYELHGLDERICRGDGDWSGEQPQCIHEDTHCSEPKFQVAHAYPDVWPERNEFYIHDQVQYKCENGFTPSRGDQSTTTCVQPSPSGSPTWTPIALTCKPTECPYPDNIDNGYYEGSSFSFNAQIFYYCNPGFTLVGSATRICLADQEWSGSLPLCKGKVSTCSDPNDLSNGFIKYKSRDFGAISWSHCDPGYILNGPVQRECLSDGTWSGKKPVCTEMNCGQPDSPEYGKIININGTTLNSFVEYECNERSIMSGPFKAHCIMDGASIRWSSSPPTCLKHCQVIEVDNGLLQHKLNEIFEGGFVEDGVSVQVTCDPGYEITATSEYSRCEDGSWVPDLNSCAPARCSYHLLSFNWLHQRNLEIVQPLDTFTEHGQRIPLQCNWLYPEMLMVDTIACNWGEWDYPENDGVRCIPRSCSLESISLSHGTIYVNDDEIDPEKQKSVVHSTVLLFDCTEPGYELYEEGNPVDYSYGSLKTCTNGTLLGFNVECRPGRCPCNALSVGAKSKNMELKGVCTENDLIENNEKIPLRCKSGFSSTPVNKPLSAKCDHSAWDVPSEQCESLQSNPQSVMMENSTSSTMSSKILGSDIEDIDITITDTTTSTTSTTITTTATTTTGSVEEEFYVIKPPTRNTDCKYYVRSDNVVGSYEGSLITRNSIFRTGTSIVFRCSDISYFMFSGKIKHLCRQGKWLGQDPACTRLQERETNSAPVIKYTFISGKGYVEDSGSLLVLEDSTLILSCLWSKENGEVVWKLKNQEIKGRDVTKEWINDDSFNLKISNVTRRRSGTYTCSTPFKMTHGINIKVVKHIEVPDEPETTTYILSTTINTTPSVTTRAPVSETTSASGNASSLVAAFVDGTRIIKARNFNPGSKLLLRCDNVFDFKLEGSRTVRCAKNEWSPQLPTCARLHSNDWNSAPPLSVLIYQNKTFAKLTENGEVIVPKNNVIYLLCKFALETPIMNVKGINVPIVKDFYNSDGDTIWYFQMGPFDTMLSFTFTCQVPRNDIELVHSLIVRVGDTCALDRKWRPVAVARTLRHTYLEGDVVQLQCKNKRSLVPSYLTCSKGGVWINGPLLKCNQV